MVDISDWKEPDYAYHFDLSNVVHNASHLCASHATAANPPRWLDENDVQSVIAHYQDIIANILDDFQKVATSNDLLGDLVDEYINDKLGDWPKGLRADVTYFELMNYKSKLREVIGPSNLSVSWVIGSGRDKSTEVFFHVPEHAALWKVIK